jgi:hypothetical protein
LFEVLFFVVLPVRVLSIEGGEPRLFLLQTQLEGHPQLRIVSLVHHYRLIVLLAASEDVARKESVADVLFGFYEEQIAGVHLTFDRFVHYLKLLPLNRRKVSDADKVQGDVTLLKLLTDDFELFDAFGNG